MSNDHIVNALNSDKQYLTTLEEFFSKHRQPPSQFVDFDAGLNSVSITDKESPEA